MRAVIQGVKLREVLASAEAREREAAYVRPWYRRVWIVAKSFAIALFEA